MADITDDPEARSGVRAYALNPERARALWARSEALVGELFPSRRRFSSPLASADPNH